MDFEGLEERQRFNQARKLRRSPRRPRCAGRRRSPQGLLAALEHASHARADAHHVQSLELDDVLIELDSTAAREDDVDLLRLAMAMREGLAAPGLDDQTSSTL